MSAPPSLYNSHFRTTLFWSVVRLSRHPKGRHLLHPSLWWLFHPILWWLPMWWLFHTLVVFFAFHLSPTFIFLFVLSPCATRSVSPSLHLHLRFPLCSFHVPHPNLACPPTIFPTATSSLPSSGKLFFVLFVYLFDRKSKVAYLRNNINKINEHIRKTIRCILPT